MAGKPTLDPRKAQQEVTAPTTPSRDDITLTEEFEAAALWMALPRKMRDPKIQGELAEKLQIQPDSISDWKKRDDFWEKVATYRGVWVREEISDGIEGLIKKAKYGAAPEVKLFLQFAGLFTETSHTERTGKGGGALERGIEGIAREAAQNAEQPPCDASQHERG